MAGLSYSIKADNSDQDMRLIFDHVDGLVCPVLIGDIDYIDEDGGQVTAKNIQIDFEELDFEEARELAEYIMKASENGKNKQK